MSKPISDKPIVKALVELCHLHGVEQVVISPGSCNAPLVISFAGYEKFECLSIVDERSAAYFALGLARETKKPVAIVCTSGTAGLNYAPAVAEAYYQQVPLVVITADRPKEWINQADGQAIEQPGIYNNFIRHQCTLPLSGGHKDDEWYMNRILNEAFQKCTGTIPGPIHINVPMREPLYGKTVYSDSPARKIEVLTGDNDSAKQLMQQEKLRELAVILTERVKQNASIDWTIKESVRAKLKVIIKRTLRQYGYPPDMQKLATETVLKQAEMIAKELTTD